MDSRNFRFSSSSFAQLASVLLLVGLQPVFGAPPDASAHVDRHAPAWATGANWYQLSVPLFHNGSKENDPPGTKPWTATCDPKNAGPSEGGAGAKPLPLYGGDLQGLQLRLDYLKRLGINALILTDVFSGTVAVGSQPVDVRHVDDSLGIKDSLAKLDHTDKDAGDALSKTDQLFVAFLKEAHQAGFRVVLSAPWPAADNAGAASATERESNAMAATRRWMDPNQDSDPSDGVDGWIFSDRSVADEPTLARWYHGVKKINDDAVVISGDGDRFDDTVCDVFVDYPGSGVFARWVRYVTVPGDYSIISSRRSDSPDRPVLDEARRICSDMSRLTSAGIASVYFKDHAGTIFTDEKYCSPGSAFLDVPSYPWSGGNLWRPAAVFQHLSGSSPLTYFGDEVGMYIVRNCARMPMWWNDLASADSQPSEYRLAFYALTKLMNQLRSRFAALRRGELRPIHLSPRSTVLVHESRSYDAVAPKDYIYDVLVFSRSLPDEEVIVVHNLGKHDRTIHVPVGYPGQLVGVLSPQIRPGRVSPFAGPPQLIGGQPVPQLGIGAQRRHADEWGDVTLDLKPESVKLIIVGGIDKR